MKPFNIADFTISQEGRTFIIAELSANHGGRLDIALETVSAAKRTGADAIKLQTYTADTITLDVKNDYFKINKGTLWDGKYLHELYQEAAMPWEWHQAIFARAKEEGLICFSSPFDPTAVDLLETLDVPAYKIASPEITDIQLIELVASKGKPVIISTGMATLEDIELAVDTCKKAGNDKVALLKCTSAYPTPLEEVNLLTLPAIQEKFQCQVGLSDHTLGSIIAGAAVALGAKVVEKHFILNKSVGGPDVNFSLTPEEFEHLVKTIRDIEMALGTVNFDLTESTIKTRSFCRSLFVSEDVKEGETLSPKNIRSVRPGQGLHPKHLHEALGKTFNRSYSKGTPLDSSMFE
jgi:pseudaminic acid synthase